jgi:hypothetical protein
MSLLLQALSGSGAGNSAEKVAPWLATPQKDASTPHRDASTSARVWVARYPGFCIFNQHHKNAATAELNRTVLRGITGCHGRSMQDPANELPRTLLLGNRVNRVCRSVLPCVPCRGQ